MRQVQRLLCSIVSDFLLTAGMTLTLGLALGQCSMSLDSLEQGIIMPALKPYAVDLLRSESANSHLAARMLCTRSWTHALSCAAVV